MDFTAGWRFDSTGACMTIPQAAGPQAEATACASQRSRASAHPTQARFCMHAGVLAQQENPLPRSANLQDHPNSVKFTLLQQITVCVPNF